MSLKILCVDDSSLCVHGLREAIGGSSHHFLGGTTRLEECFRAFSEHPPDVLIAEVRVGNLDMLEEWPRFAEIAPECKLILFSYDNNPTHIARASALDAWDFVHKRSPLLRLLQACDSVERGERSSESLLLVARHYLMHAKCLTGTLPQALTRREQQVLLHLSLGLSNREISRSLHISLETVKEHVQNVLRKVRASDRTAAAVWAIRNGTPTMLVDPSSLLAGSLPPTAHEATKSVD